MGRLVPRVSIGLIHDASEAISLCRIADRIPGNLRKRTQGTLKLHAGCRIVVDVMRGNDPFPRDVLLDPSFEGRQEVVISIDHRPVAGAIAEGIWTIAAAAMRHTGSHEQPIELL